MMKAVREVRVKRMEECRLSSWTGWRNLFLDTVEGRRGPRDIVPAKERRGRRRRHLGRGGARSGYLDRRYTEIQRLRGHLGGIKKAPAHRRDGAKARHFMCWRWGMSNAGLGHGARGPCPRKCRCGHRTYCRHSYGTCTLWGRQKFTQKPVRACSEGGAAAIFQGEMRWTGKVQSTRISFGFLLKPRPWFCPQKCTYPHTGLGRLCSRLGACERAEKGGKLGGPSFKGRSTCNFTRDGVVRVTWNMALCLV